MAKIRVNLANQLELLEIPGLEPAQAEAIVRHRARHGPISDAAQLTAVLGGRPLPAAVYARLDFDPADVTSPEAPGA